MNKFEQVSSGDHQMLVAGGGGRVSRSHVQAEGVGYPGPMSGGGGVGYPDSMSWGVGGGRECIQVPCPEE